MTGFCHPTNHLYMLNSHTNWNLPDTSTSDGINLRKLVLSPRLQPHLASHLATIADVIDPGGGVGPTLSLAPSITALTRL